MAYVSVGQVENLEETLMALNSTYEALEGECQVKLQEVATAVDQARQEAEYSNGLLEKARQVELAREQALQQAEAQLASAQAAYASAQGALAACEASGYYDSEGEWQQPDCSSEASEVAAAEAEVAEAEQTVDQATGELEQAKEHRMQMERRNELAQQSLALATGLQERVQAECAARLSQAAGLLAIGNARVGQAKQALEAYLAANTQAASFYSWLTWKPKNNVPVTVAELDARLNLRAEQHRYFIEYLADRDPEFRVRIAEYRKELEAAQTPAERRAVQLKIQRNLSGLYGEKMVSQALSPLAENVNTQARTTFEDGKYTKTDLILEGLKVPIILGRGKGMAAPAGGSLAIEVKCGQAAYLYNQKGHMIFQSGGHQGSSASLTICSRDIKDLTPEQEEELRNALRQAGSPLIGLLPRKDEIDQACWEAVLGKQVKEDQPLPPKEES